MSNHLIGDIILAPNYYFDSVFRSLAQAVLKAKYKLIHELQFSRPEKETFIQKTIFDTFEKLFKLPELCLTHEVKEVRLLALILSETRNN